MTDDNRDRPRDRSDLTPAEREATIYRVVVDVEIRLTKSRIARLFNGGLIESISPIDGDRYQVSVSTRAPNDGEAYRRAVNYVESVVECAQLHMTGGVLGATVYGEDGTVTFD